MNPQLWVSTLRSRLAGSVLTVGAVLGVLCVVVAVLAPLLGVRGLVVRSGSMQPAISTGDLVLAVRVPTADVAPGEVVSVRTPAGERVTHRVVAVGPGVEGTAALTLQGDANEGADPTPYLVEQVDRVVVVVPWAGRIVAAASSPLVVVGLLAAIVLGGRAPQGGRHRGGRRRRTPVAGVGTAALAASVAVTAVSAVPAEAAAWTDEVPVTAAATATTVAAPTLSCGALGVLSVTFLWDAVPGATSYRLFWNGGTNALTVDAPTTSATVMSVINLSSTAWVVARREFANVTWSSGPSNSRSFTAAVVSLCS